MSASMSECNISHDPDLIPSMPPPNYFINLLRALPQYIPFHSGQWSEGTLKLKKNCAKKSCLFVIKQCTSTHASSAARNGFFLHKSLSYFIILAMVTLPSSLLVLGLSRACSSIK